MEQASQAGPQMNFFDYSDPSAAAYICDGCGACCKTFPIYVCAEDAVREPRIAAEAVALDPNLAPVELAYGLFPLPFQESCCFLGSDNRCGIYETRPSVCRAFAAGDDQCQEARGRLGLPPLLPNTAGPLLPGTVPQERREGEKPNARADNAP
jgi:Fe-S-cluster containining protein